MTVEEELLTRVDELLTRVDELLTRVRELLKRVDELLTTVRELLEKNDNIEFMLHTLTTLVNLIKIDLHSNVRCQKVFPTVKELPS